MAESQRGDLPEYGRPSLDRDGVRPTQGTPPRSSRTDGHASAIALLDEWLADDSGYDERIWPAVRSGIERARTSTRRRFRWQANRC